MATLTFAADSSTLTFVPKGLTRGTDVESWSASTKRGTRPGVCVRVPGAGSVASMSGTMAFTIINLDSSKTYDRMKKEYSIGGGVSAFRSWLEIKANADAHKEEICEVFKELADSPMVTCTLKYDLQVTGLYPNVPVEACAYVLALEIQDSSGNTFFMVSSGDPKSDTGAQDQNGIALPQKDNSSSITF